MPNAIITLYFNQIVLNNIKFEDVPPRLKEGVRQMLADSGLEMLLK